MVQKVSSPFSFSVACTSKQFATGLELYKQYNPESDLKKGAIKDLIQSVDELRYNDSYSICRALRAIAENANVGPRTREVAGRLLEHVRTAFLQLASVGPAGLSGANARTGTAADIRRIKRGVMDKIDSEATLTEFPMRQQYETNSVYMPRLAAWLRYKFMWRVQLIKIRVPPVPGFVVAPGAGAGPANAGVAAPADGQAGSGAGAATGGNTAGAAVGPAANPAAAGAAVGSAANPAPAGGAGNRVNVPKRQRTEQGGGDAKKTRQLHKLLREFAVVKGQRVAKAQNTLEALQLLPPEAQLLDADVYQALLQAAKEELAKQVAMRPEQSTF